MDFERSRSAPDTYPFIAWMDTCPPDCTVVCQVLYSSVGRRLFACFPERRMGASQNRPVFGKCSGSGNRAAGGIRGLEDDGCEECVSRMQSSALIWGLCGN